MDKLRKSGLNKKNYYLLILCAVILVIAYFIMNTGDITISPIILIITYLILIPFALLFPFKNE